MATGRLTWQNVAAPDFSGAAQTQSIAAEAMDRALGRVSGAIAAFDNNRKDMADAAVLRNAMQYQNADELQAAIASGALMNGVNPDHVRVDALLKAQQQAGQLMALDKDRQQLATSKQMFEFNKLRNPQLLEEGRLTNATTQQQLDQNAALHAPKLAQEQTKAAAEAFDLGKARTQFRREEEEYAANLAAADRVAAMQSSGEYYDPQAVSRLYSNLNMSDPVHRALRKTIATDYPDLVKNFTAPGSFTGQGTQVPTGTLAGIGGTTQGNVLGRALYGQESNFGQAKTDHVNEHGVTGPMQVQDVTWREMQRLNIIPKDWNHKDPEQNLEAGFRWADYLTQKHGGDLARAAAEYYGGPKAVNSDGTINRHYRDLKDPKAPTVGQYVDQVMQRIARGQAPGSTPQTAARPTATTMGVPQTTNATAPAQVAPSTPTAPAPAAGQLSPENAAILARVTQQTLGLGQSAGNTAELSSFAAAAADKKTSFEEAGKSIVEAFPGLDRRDVDEMLTQVQAMHPMLRNPAAAAYVIKNTPKTSAWYDPFNWGNNIQMDEKAIEAKVAELTKPEAVKAGVLANEVSTNIGTKVAEAEKNLAATNDSILTLQEQLRNAAPGSARANALQSEITRLGGKAADYRSQIDSRSSQEEALYEQLARSANPELYAKQQKEAEQRKSAAAAAERAANGKSKPSQDQQALTTERIAQMSLPELNAIVGKAYADLTQEQRAAMVTRRMELARQR